MPKGKRKWKTHQRLRAWRMDSDLTVDALADKLDCSQGTLSNIELGKRGVGLALALNIQRVTGIKMEDW